MVKFTIIVVDAIKLEKCLNLCIIIIRSPILIINQRYYLRHKLKLLVLLRGGSILDHAIAVISPSSILTQKMEEEISRRNLNIVVKQAFTDDAINESEELILKGVRVLISRGHTASVLRENLDIPIVDVKHTFFDCYTAYFKARKISNKIVFLASSKEFESILHRSREFLKGIEILPIDLSEDEDVIDIRLKGLVDRGIEVAVGGLTLESKVKKLGIEYIMSEADSEAIDQALAEATHLAKIELEREERRIELENKYEMINSILNCVSDGVISYDRDGVIANVNYNAKKMLGKDILNKNVNDLFQSELFMKSIKEGKYFNNEILSIGKVSLVVNLEPIKVGSKVVGSVATLQKSKHIQEVEQKIRNSMLEKGHVAQAKFDNILGESQEINQTKNIAKKYAMSKSTVLIFGETGTGKELFAQSIHNHSDRNDKPFVAINCGAFPPNLLESELFGYVKGAFTGALNEGKPGIFQLAHGGTIFLDEISETPLEVQIKLLRVIQERKIVRIGDDKVTPIDVRIVAASNKDLKEEVNKGRFREDLYYRICVLELKIPNLEERKEDIPHLINHYIKNGQISINLITNKAINMLKETKWPGNIRQLNNIMERLAIVSVDGVIDSDMVNQVLDITTDDNVIVPDDEKTVKKDITEEELIKHVLIETKGNRKRTADILGISTTTLWRKINKYEEINEDFLERVKYADIDI